MCLVKNHLYAYKMCVNIQRYSYDIKLYLVTLILCFLVPSVFIIVNMVVYYLYR